MQKVGFVFGVSLLLAGCAVERGSVRWFESASQEEKAEFFSEKCQGYGFKAESEGMASCIQKEALNAAGRTQSFYDRQRDALSKSMDNISDLYQTVRSDCTTTGSSTSCTAY